MLFIVLATTWSAVVIELVIESARTRGRELVAFGSVLAARFPSSGSSPDPGLYLYADGSVGIVTATVAPNGSAVTGTLTVK